MNVKELLERKGIKVLKDYNYCLYCEYKNNKFTIQHNDANINPTYTLYRDNKVITTRAYITTCINKILNIKEDLK